MNLDNKVLGFSVISILAISTLSSRWLDGKAIADTPLDAVAIVYEHPAFPTGQGRPRGRRKGAAGLSGDGEDACLSQHSNLVALVPEFNRGETWGLTTLPYPSFFFVMPDLPDDVRVAEFVLEDTTVPGVGSDVYRTRLNLPGQTGTIRIDLPQEEKYQLKPDRKYRWGFKVYCSLDEDRPSSIFVSGNIIRTQVGSYADNQIWYDRLKELAEKANNKTFRERWNNLLSAIDLEDVAEADLLPCCTPDSESTDAATIAPQRQLFPTGQDSPRGRMRSGAGSH